MTKKKPVARLSGSDAKNRRLELARLAGQFLIRQNERDAGGPMEELARCLARDASEAVREALALEVKACPNLAPDIADRIARDVRRVSQPFLEVSLALSSTALEEIVRECDEWRREIIAGRADLPENVSEAISEVGEKPSVHRLLENESAEINAPAFKAIMERFRDEESILQQVARRDDIPLSALVLLINRLSDTTRDWLTAKYGLEAEDAGYLAEVTGLRAISSVLDTADGRELTAYLERMKAEGRLTAIFFLNLLRAGGMHPLIQAMSILSGLNARNVKAILGRGTEADFSNLLQHCDLDKKLAPLFSATYRESLIRDRISAA